MASNGGSSIIWHAAYRTDRMTAPIGPWAVVASLPFAPEIVLPAIEYLVHEVDLKSGNPYGFKATFNPTYPDKSGNPHAGYRRGITASTRGRSIQ